MTARSDEKDVRPSYLDRVTILVRNRRNMIHRRECRHAGRPTTLPWIWAEGKTRAEVKASEANGLQFCRTCDPLAAVPAVIPPGGES
jgi:hypothetical protein